jgi:ABC-type glycerol-3-phosphate transport system substrate-binding protein
MSARNHEGGSTMISKRSKLYVVIVLATCFALGGWLHQAQANPYAKYAGTTLVVNFPSHPYYEYAIKLLPEFTKETGIKVDVDKIIHEDAG